MTDLVYLTFLTSNGSQLKGKPMFAHPHLKQKYTVLKGLETPAPEQLSFCVGLR